MHDAVLATALYHEAHDNCLAQLGDVNCDDLINEESTAFHHCECALLPFTSTNCL